MKEINIYFYQIYSIYVYIGAVTKQICFTLYPLARARPGIYTCFQWVAA